ncbi:MAG: ATP-binding protein, partial [Eggerthellaceae bacterium]|nr:ATP-binding protein [Eggerthellaceae bacterium]
MLKRTAYNQLLDWKSKSHQKALLVDGPRQVGKTFLLEEFGKHEYRDFVKIDFLRDQDAQRRFGLAASAERVIELVSLAVGHEVIPGETLVFFDEVQKAQNLVTFSKYLAIDGRFDVAMSGSMLGVELTGVKSWPVGYLHTIDMAPLTFEEFCWARGVPQSVVEQMQEGYETKRPLDSSIHGLLVDLFRQYLVIGGMPEAVQKSIDAHNDLGAVRQVQADLLTLYREDIAKYAGNRAFQVKAIYDAVPSQINKENKRFQLKTLKDGARFERYANDFAWLVAARSALKTVNVTDPKPMLSRTEEQERFKLYLSDVGMLFASYPAEVAMAALTGDKAVNFGSVYENVIAQELAALRSPLRYYHHSRT